MSKNKRRRQVCVDSAQRVEFRAMNAPATVTEATVPCFQIESEFTCATLGVLRKPSGSATPYEAVIQTWPGPACEIPPGMSAADLATGHAKDVTDLTEVPRFLEFALNAVVNSIREAFDALGNDGEEVEIAVSRGRGLLKHASQSSAESFPARKGGFVA